jgi:TPR repeat protein
MKLYYKSAELGYSEAQFKIGKIFENKKMSDNIEVEIENYNEAIRWYQKASEQGHLGAKEKIVGAKEALKSMTKLAELNKLVKVLDMNPLEKVLILDQSTGDQFDRFEDNGGLKFASEWRGYFVTKLKTQYRKGNLKVITMTLETVRGSNKLTSVNNIKNDLKAECGSDWSRLGEDSLGQYIAESPSVKCDMTRHKDGNISIGLFSKIE